VEEGGSHGGRRRFRTHLGHERQARYFATGKIVAFVLWVIAVFFVLGTFV